MEITETGFAGNMPLLTPNQQSQSIWSTDEIIYNCIHTTTSGKLHK